MVGENAPMVSVEGINLSVGEFSLKDISLSVGHGEYLMLLGPTGCGKTLLVETICGLNRPDGGRIFIDGRDVTRADPAKRNIGYVPQDYALLPFKTVERNIAFGLQARRFGRPAISERIETILDMLDMSHLRHRYPAHLSGGERQRVALGRALAIEPDLLVLDEPLSALDEETFRELIERLKNLREQLATTIIHICHRLDEAVALGDAIALMRNGRIEQAGATRELFENPGSIFVARFLQMRNLIRGEVTSAPGGNLFSVNGAPVAKTDLSAGEAYGILPLDELSLSVDPPGDEEGFAVLSGLIAGNSTGPFEPGLSLDAGIGLMIPGIFPRDRWPVGRTVYIKFPSAKARILQADSGRE